MASTDAQQYAEALRRSLMDGLFDGKDFDGSRSDGEGGDATSGGGADGDSTSLAPGTLPGNEHAAALAELEAELGELAAHERSLIPI